MTTYIKLDDLIQWLKESESINIKSNIGFKIIPRIKPGHGPCCTCQICGYNYDDCVCDHNDTVAWIESLEKLEV